MNSLLGNLFGCCVFVSFLPYIIYLGVVIIYICDISMFLDLIGLIITKKRLPSDLYQPKIIASY